MRSSVAGELQWRQHETFSGKPSNVVALWRLACPDSLEGPPVECTQQLSNRGVQLGFPAATEK
jgi:hypothetical protein